MKKCNPLSRPLSPAAFTPHGIEVSHDAKGTTLNILDFEEDLDFEVVSNPGTVTVLLPERASAGYTWSLMPRSECDKTEHSDASELPRKKGKTSGLGASHSRMLAFSAPETEQALMLTLILPGLMTESAINQILKIHIRLKTLSI